MKNNIHYLTLAMFLLDQTSAAGIGETVFPCNVTTDCIGINPYYECKMNEKIEVPRNECVHKALFPMYPKEIVGTFVFMIIMLLSNVAGIGGGGIAIPLAIYFFELSMKPAIAISSFAILCSTIARFLYNFSERHPEKSGCTSIDYNMTTVMMPLTLLGSLIGAYVYKSFPDLYICIILTLLLVVFTFESTKKYLSLRADEVKKEKLAAEGLDLEPGAAKKTATIEIEFAE